MRIHQRFDPLCGLVEALAQESHFVFAVSIDSDRQITLTPALHATLQGFQPLRQPADDRVTAQCHGQRNQA